MRKLMTFAVSLTMMILTLPVYAQEASIEISIDGVARGDAGEVVEVATETVDPDLVGAECAGTLTILNNESVHDGNALIVTTGGVEQVIPDVEAQPEGTIALTESLTLGDTITVDLRFGPDGVSSGGLVLSLVCSQVAVTTTTASAPTGGVQTGAGGTAGSNTGLVISLVVLSALAVGGGTALLRSRRAS